MSRLISTTLIVVNGQAKKRRCPGCGRRVGILRRCWLEHFTRTGQRCAKSGEPTNG